MLGLFSGLQALGIESLFQRNLPPRIRGVMMSYLRFFIIAGQGLFGAAAGYVFDKKGPSAPFTLVAILDAAFVIIFLIFMCRRRSLST